MHALRIVPALFIYFLIQLGLHRVLSSIFFPRLDQGRARRRLAWLLGVAMLFFPLQVASIRQGVQIPAALRLSLIEPVLGWLVMGIPLLASLSLARMLVRRWPRAKDEAPAPPHIIRTDAPSASEPATSPEVEHHQSLLPRARRARAQEPESLPEPPRVLPERRRVFLARSGAAILGGAGLLIARGVREAEEVPLVSRNDIRLRGLHPDLDGLTILQLSDIHSGALITEERMRSFATAAAALSADVIVFTGDLLDGSGRAAAPYSRAFEGLHGKLGTYAILGNHDYYAGERFAIRAVRDAGQTLLRNSGARISRGRGSLWMGGVDDPLIRDAGGEVDPKKALAGAAPEEARIVLAHRPGLFELCAEAGAQLVLSGHTHGGQLAFSRTFTPARLLGRFTMGRYQEGPAQLYVHRGMGVVGALPVRLGSPPELALLTLRRV